MMVKDVMTRDLVVGEMDYTLSALENILNSKRIGHIFIIDNGVLRGVVSDGDIKRRKSFLAGTDLSTTREEFTLDLKAHQIMSRKLISLNEHATVTEAIDALLKHDIHCLPVINDRDRLVGIITGSDLLRLMKKLINNQ
ncbi:MAG: CBS domain-containing protein [Lentisphaerales bacterium]|nr:CBS domain-containing protein [Lentisphaerales bacterium]